MQVHPEEPLARVQRKLERRVGLPVREQQLLVCAHSEATGRLRYSLLPSASPAASAARDARDCLERVARPETAVLVRDVLERLHGERADASQPPVVLALADATDVRFCGAPGSVSETATITATASAAGNSAGDECAVNAGASANAVLLAPFFAVYVSVVDGKTLWLAHPVQSRREQRVVLTLKVSLFGILDTSF